MDIKKQAPLPPDIIEYYDHILLSRKMRTLEEKIVAVLDMVKRRIGHKFTEKDLEKVSLVRKLADHLASLYNDNCAILL